MSAPIRSLSTDASAGASRPDRVVLSPDCVHREVGEQVFIVMPDSTLHHLDTPTAFTLWDTIRRAAPGGASIDDLTGALVASFEVDAETARKDAARIVEELSQGGVVVSAGAPAPVGHD